MQSRNKAVVPRDLVALGELRDRLNLPFNLLQLACQRADAHDGLQLITKTFGVDLDGIAFEHAPFFKTPQTFGDTRLRQPTDVRQRLERTPGILHQCCYQHLINIVGHGETSLRQLIKSAFIKKADSNSSLLFALEKPAGE